MTYTAKTEDEINKIALGCLSGTCFGSWDEEVAKLSFNIVTMCLTKELIETWKAQKIAHFYEFIDKAGPMAINGYPSFMSFNLIDEADCARVTTKLEALRKTMGEKS